MMGRTITALIILTGTLWAGATQADIFKWTDKRGRVVYGDNPPANVKVERVNVQNAPRPDPNTVKRLEEQNKFLENQANERKQENEEGDKARMDAQRKEELCADARKRLTTLENNARVYIMEEGKRKYLTEEERQAEFAQARQDIEKACQ